MPANTSDLGIDENQLDREWIDQPKRYFQAAQNYAASRRKVDEAKAELDVVRAELSKDIRSRPEVYGLFKVTEGAIESTLVLQSEYVQAQKALIDASYHTSIYSGYVSAMEQRKSALENLVKLHLAGYFASPRAPEGSEAEVDEMEKKLLRQRGIRQ